MKRIGIMGCGKIAQVRHIPELATNPNAQLAGYYNPTIKRAEQMAQKYGGKVYNCIEELLSDPKNCVYKVFPKERLQPLNPSHLAFHNCHS